MREFINRLAESVGVGGYDPAAVGVELLLIGLVVYTILRFLHGTRGARLFQGVLFLLISSFLVVRLLADTFEWARIRILYQYFMWGVFLTALVVFQPELRRGLMRLGETAWLRRYFGPGKTVVEPIVAAAGSLSKQKIGALIALERHTQLGALADTGVRLNAVLSAELLETIFWPGSTLHDLGVIVRGEHVAAAGCQFPLTESGQFSRVLGSRHRAAIGLSEESDAVVVVVSEETGTISVAQEGRLDPVRSGDQLRHTLQAALSLQVVGPGGGEKQA